MAALAATAAMVGVLAVQGTGLGATAKCRGNGRVELSVWLGNQAAIPPDILRGGNDRMAAVFEQIGVRVVWRDDPREQPPPLIALIVPEGRATALRTRDTAALGTAILDEVSGGRAYVFYERVVRRAAEHRVDATLALGAALAHEAAHIILGKGAHTAAGLMRASWGDQEFRLMRAGMLVFSSGEAQAIRRALEAQSLAVCRE